MGLIDHLESFQGTGSETQVTGQRDLAYFSGCDTI